MDEEKGGKGGEEEQEEERGRRNVPGMMSVWAPPMNMICIGPNWVMPSCLRWRRL